MFVLRRRNSWRIFEKRKEKPRHWRKIIYQVKGLAMKYILQTAKDRNDQWGQDLQFCIGTVSDLVAAEVQYQHSCLTKFFTPVTNGEKLERPFVTDVVSAIKTYYHEESREECQFFFKYWWHNRGYIPDEKTIEKETNWQIWKWHSYYKN